MEVRPQQAIGIGSAVQLGGGGPVMTVIAADEPPPSSPFSEIAPTSPWKPGSWRCAWYVQRAIRYATLPGKALRVVAPREGSLAIKAE